MDWQRSVFRLTGPEPSERPQGTGFVVAQDTDAVLVVTGWHVVETIGQERLHLKGRPRQLVSNPGDAQLDLAVLRVEGVVCAEPMALSARGWHGLDICTYGFGPEGRLLSGRLGQQAHWLHADDDEDDIVHCDYYLDVQAGAFERIKVGIAGRRSTMPPTGASSPSSPTRSGRTKASLWTWVSCSASILSRRLGYPLRGCPPSPRGLDLARRPTA
jgi:hypothetical protein